MPVKRKITEPDGVYFITITCHQWISLIEKTHGFDLVYKWFDHLKTKGHYIIGYVIMPNHLHALIAFRNAGQSINIIIVTVKDLWPMKLLAACSIKTKSNCFTS